MTYYSAASNTLTVRELRQALEGLHDNAWVVLDGFTDGSGFITGANATFERVSLIVDDHDCEENCDKRHCDDGDCNDCTKRHCDDGDCDDCTNEDHDNYSELRDALKAIAEDKVMTKAEMRELAESVIS